MTRTCRFCKEEATLGYSDWPSTCRCRACDLIYHVAANVAHEAIPHIRAETDVAQVRRALEWIKGRGAKTVQHALEVRLRKLERSAKR